MTTRGVDEHGVHPVQAFVSRAREVLSADTSVAAVLLERDLEVPVACSDVSLLVVVEDCAYSEFLARRLATLASIAGLAYHRDLPRGWDGVAAITITGLRVAVRFERASRIGDRSSDRRSVIIDRTRQATNAPGITPGDGAAPLDRLAEALADCTALLPALAALGDLRTAVANVAALRGLQVALMCIESQEPRGGASASTPLRTVSLSEGQIRAVERTLGTPRLDVEILARQQDELAQDVCERAERLAVSRGHGKLSRACKYLRRTATRLAPVGSHRDV